MDNSVQNIINMLFKHLLLLLVLNEVTGQSKCPQECVCNLDTKGRLETVCTRGGMRTIPVTAFDNQVEVIVIRGPRNALTIGPIFQTFTKLEVLSIVDSNVPAIGTNSFWGLKTLRHLDLSQNNITQLAENNFRGQDNLLELDLSKNKMERMPSGTFRFLKELRSMDLSGNAIEELVQRLFLMLSKLRMLDLSSNPLLDLPPEVFKDVQDLRVLKCRNCKLQKINPQLYNLLRKLTELDLGDNQFKYFEKDEFKDLKRLTRLRIDGNQLSVVIDKLFVAQHSLQFLDLSRNRLAKVTNHAFESLTNLTWLDLSYNKLSYLESASVKPVIHLRTLNISGNIQLDLDDIQNTFTHLNGLHTLSVADMGSLPMNLLGSLQHLRGLNLSGNHLDNASIQIIHPVLNLEMVDLTRNQISAIGEMDAIRLRKINDVKHSNNPFICDRCHMGALIRRVNMLKWQSLPVCFLPENLRGASIGDLESDALSQCLDLIEAEDHDAASTSHNFLEQGKLNAFAFLGAIIFVVIVCVIVMRILCFSKHRARYYTHEEKRAEMNGEKVAEAPAAINGNEISFKFPMDDRVCTIDEMCLPPPPPPPSKSAPPNG